MRLPFTLALLAVLLAGCDASDSAPEVPTDETDSEVPTDLEVTTKLPDTIQLSPYGPVEINLLDSFETSDPARLSFAVVRQRGAVSGSVRDERILVIEPRSVGSGSLEVALYVDRQFRENAVFIAEVAELDTTPDPPTVTLRTERRQAYSLRDQFVMSESYPATLDVNQTTGPISASIQNDTLTVAPTGVGEASVEVVATGFVTQSKTFRFVFLDACPTNQPAGTADYFPLEAGTEWGFFYLYHYSRRGSGNPYSGGLDWEFTSVLCDEGKRIATVLTTFRGGPTVPRPISVLEVVEQENNDVWFTTSDLTDYEESTFVVPRYAPPSDTLKVSLFEGTVSLVPGVGPVDVVEDRRFPLGGRFESTMVRR